LSRHFVSDYRQWCQGATGPNRYLLALNVAAAAVPVRFANSWSDGLDAVCAFDAAETARVHMGQINLITVSSFCSPDAYIWGLDLADSGVLSDEPMFRVGQGVGSLPVFDGAPLVDAAAALFGAGRERVFPLAPGTHCRAAAKWLVRRGPGTLYSAFGLGLRPPCLHNQASLIMEDVGFVPSCDPASEETRQRVVMENVAHSVLAVAANQGVRYAAVLTAYAETAVAEGEVGCSLIAAPYYTLAQDALPRGGINALRRMGLGDWRREMAFAGAEKG